MTEFIGNLNWVGGMIGALLALIFGICWQGSSFIGRKREEYFGKEGEDGGGSGGGRELLGWGKVVTTLSLAMLCDILLGILAMMIDSFSRDKYEYALMTLILIVVVAGGLFHRFLFEDRLRARFFIRWGYIYLVITIVIISSSTAIL